MRKGKDPDPDSDPYLRLMDPDPVTVGPKPSEPGSPTLQQGSLNFRGSRLSIPFSDLQVTKIAIESHFLPVLWIRDILEWIPIWIRASDQWIRIRILIFSSLTFKAPTKDYRYFFTLHFKGTFTSFIQDKKSNKSRKT